MNLEKNGGEVSKEKFTVTGRPDDGYLFLQFPGNPDIFTQARYFNEIEEMALDAIYLMRDIPKKNIELAYELEVPADFPKSYVGFIWISFINTVRNFAQMKPAHTAPSADGHKRFLK